MKSIIKSLRSYIPFRRAFVDFINRPVNIILAGSIFVFLFCSGLRISGNFEFLELSAYDLFVRMRPKIMDENHKITLIEISEMDIQDIGSWPLSDELLAKALKIILAGKPTAVGVDIYRDIPVPPGSEELNKIFSDTPQLVGVMSLGKKLIDPLAIIKGTDQAAFCDILVDPGGIVRRGLLFVDDGVTSHNSFAFKMASLYLERERVGILPDPENPQFIRLNKTTIQPLEENDGGYVKADAGGYQFLLDYLDAGKQFQTYQLADLLSGKVPVQAMANRIILVGVSAQSVKDYFYTPLSLSFEKDNQVSGIVLHGQIIGQLLRFALADQKPMAYIPKLYESIWLLFWCLVGGTIGAKIRSALRFCILILVGITTIVCICYVLFINFWWIPLVPPILSFSGSTFVVAAYFTGREKKERALLMQLFSKHVSQEIAEMLWKQRSQFLDHGRPRSRKLMATILFTDLRGFTSMSEKMDPQDLIDWLNTYMEVMCGIIMEYSGIIDDFFGDAIKADFGIPLPRVGEDEIRMDVRNAVDCALRMEQEMRRLNAEWREKGQPALGMRVGIYTGIVVAGLLGSSERTKYTTIGDAVNIASRLESYDKNIGVDSICRILIGEATHRYLGGAYQTEQIGEVSLKGKDLKINVHRVFGKK